MRRKEVWEDPRSRRELCREAPQRSLLFRHSLVDPVAPQLSWIPGRRFDEEGDLFSRLADFDNNFGSRDDRTPQGDMRIARSGREKDQQLGCVDCRQPRLANRERRMSVCNGDAPWRDCNGFGQVREFYRIERPIEEHRNSKVARQLDGIQPGFESPVFRSQDCAALAYRLQKMARLDELLDHRFRRSRIQPAGQRLPEQDKGRGHEHKRNPHGPNCNRAVSGSGHGPTSGSRLPITNMRGLTWCGGGSSRRGSARKFHLKVSFETVCPG